MRQRNHLLSVVGLLLLLSISVAYFRKVPTKIMHSHTVSQQGVSRKIVPTATVPPDDLKLLPIGYGEWTGQGEWPSYLFGNEGDGFNSSETTLNPTSAPKLIPYWNYHANGAISSQSVEANGIIYWGSWDGLEHATDLGGHQIWATDVGQTRDGNCDPSLAGVADTATVATVTINGIVASVLFVGGGDAAFYALDAADGRVLWRTQLGSSPEHFLWSSPRVYQRSVYIGMASFGDCPTVQGQIIQLDAATGNIQHIFSIVPDGCTGGGIWSSPGYFGENSLHLYRC